jgi:hypothetical protein
MTKNHEALLEAAKTAADELFSDRSVSRAETRSSLEDLLGHIEVMRDTLHDAAEE